MLTLVGAALAVGLELLEALAIVLAVGSTRRWRDAVIGAARRAARCAVLAAVLGRCCSPRLPLEPLRVVIGTLLLLFGLEWLRKGVLRLAGRRSRVARSRSTSRSASRSRRSHAPPPGRPDWPARIVAFKGVLLEGVEVVLIVAALGARPDGLAARGRRRRSLAVVS